jgi:glucosamine-phosphate N-acetyltransferase
MIRELRKSDLTKDFFVLLEQLGGATRKYDVDDLWSKYLSGISRAFVFLQGDKVIGTASILMEEKFMRGGSSVGHIEDVVVDSDCRSLGVGRVLIDRCIESAKDFGCYKVILSCQEKNLPFYIKRGFYPDSYCVRREIKD